MNGSGSYSEKANLNYVSLAVPGSVRVPALSTSSSRFEVLLVQADSDSDSELLAAVVHHDDHTHERR